MPPPNAGQDLPDRLRTFAFRASRVDSPVHIQGETGCGKTHLANAIHNLSACGDRPIVSINCGAIAADLIDRELHGNVRGAYTGAVTDAPGLIETANRSTLFLDEIGHLPLDHQAKFLTVLEEKIVRAVGSTRCRKVDFRLISAATRPLTELVAVGEFLPELLYRIRVLVVVVPPLRERLDEVPGLTGGYLRARLGVEVPLDEMLGPRALDALTRYEWPGNIRELHNVLTQAIFIAEGHRIRIRHIREALSLTKLPASQGQPARRKPRYQAPENPDLERATIVEAFETEEWNKSRAAQRLGMARNTLLWKMDRYGIVRDKPRTRLSRRERIPN